MALQYIEATDFPSAFGRSIRLAWEERNINVANNTSDIYWELQGYNRVNDSTGYYYSGPFELKINGTTIFTNRYPDGSRVQLRNIVTARNNYSAPNNGLVASGTTTITHDNDGSKSVAVSFSCDYISDSAYTASGSGSIPLTVIPRASTITINSGTKMFGMAVTVDVQRASEAFTHTVTIAVGDHTQERRNVDTSTSFLLQSAWADACPTSSKTTFTVTCETYNGDTPVGEPYVLTDEVIVSPVWKPTIGSFTADGVNVFGDYTLKDVSHVLLTASNVSPSRGSRIVSYSFSGNNVSANYSTNATSQTATTGTLTTAGTNTWKVTVTDARGRSQTATVTKTVTAYTFPTVRLTVSRCDSDGTANDLGEYMTAKAVCTFDTSLTNNKGYVSIYMDDGGGGTPTLLGQARNQSASPFTLTTTPVAAGSTSTYLVYAYMQDEVLVGTGSDVYVSTRLSTAEVLMDVRKDGIAFGGSATRSKAVEIKNWAFCANNHRQYPGLQLKSTDQSTIGGWVWLACGLINGLYVGRRVAFSQYSYDSSTGEQTSQFETYRFPEVDADLASQKNYEILTEKTMTPITDTWEPTISWSNGSTLTTTSVACNFQKYGKLIHYYGYFRITDLGTVANKNLRITLPHTVLGTANGVGTRLEAENPPAKGLLIRVASNYLQVVYSPSGGWSCPQMSTGWYSFDLWAIEA